MDKQPILNRQETSKFPHIIRIAFGNCFSSKQMNEEINQVIKVDASGIWDNFGGVANVSWFVNGKSVADKLSELGAPNIRLIHDDPLMHDPSVSFWYNKTMLILEAFKEFGMKSSVLYLDCDVQFKKNPDTTMHQLLADKIAAGSRILSPIRICMRPKRLMLPSKPQANKRICPCNCLMYCEDGAVIEEMLSLYGEVAELYDKTKKIHWTGTETTQWDDETLAMYWFDKASSGACSTQEVVDAFEPPSVITLQRHPPEESSRLKNPELLYLVHH